MAFDFCVVHANIHRMKPKNLYLALCVAGTVIPYLEFVPWLAEHGLNLRRLVQELFLTRIGAFFGLDVMVSAIVLPVFTWVERERLKVRWWWLPILATFLVGVSLGLPLLLYLRENELQKANFSGAQA